MGIFLTFSAFSLTFAESLLILSALSVGRRSNTKLRLESPNKLDFDNPSGSFCLNKLPQLMRRDAAGEQFKNRICSESRPKVFGLAPEWRRSFGSTLYSLVVKLGE